ncbi:MAG: putative glycosyl transferase [Microgenomates bacterium OLB23]|nr:MAG: putative glycosyl transferase [Microgenomates bacterium OLB23]
MEKVSFVTTVKNDAAGTQMLFASLLQQQRLPDEVVVVDACSTDGTHKVLEDFEKKYKSHGIAYKIIRKACNRAAGRNMAIQAAAHTIIAVSDAGCVLQHNWLKKICTPFTDKKIDVVAGFYKGAYKSYF